MKKLLLTALTPSILESSLKISFVVGSVLNLINQGENFLQSGKISWLHLALNYLVPYCVASYSAAKNELGKGEKNGEQSGLQ